MDCSGVFYIPIFLVAILSQKTLPCSTNKMIGSSQIRRCAFSQGLLAISAFFFARR